MWRADFYEKNRRGGGLYRLFMGTGWTVGLGALAWHGMTTSTPDPAGTWYLGAGFLLFMYAKVSQFRPGRWISFGADMNESMPALAACSYLFGYALMIAGFLTVFWD